MKFTTQYERWHIHKATIFLAAAGLLILVLSVILFRSNSASVPVRNDSSAEQAAAQGASGLRLAQVTSTPTSSTTPTATADDLAYLPLIARTDITRRRPYSSNSVWNTPIDDHPVYDRHSQEMIATIGLNGDGRIHSDPNQYSYPVYYADEDTPRWDVPCLRYDCTVVEQHQTMTTPMLYNVPIPANARPSTGTDGQMIIIDRLTLTEYDLYEARRTADGWAVSNASTYNILWDGTPERYGSRGAGVPYMAGLIRPWEIEAGKIEHVLAFGYPQPAADQCVFPATKTDGKSDLPYAIPQGAHLQLDPSLREADFNRMGLSRTGKVIARALQQYGMVLIDTSGRSKIYVENLIDNPYTTIQWTDPELKLEADTIAGIPYSAFRVLKLPNDYWNPDQAKPTYGDCYR